MFARVLFDAHTTHLAPTHNIEVQGTRNNNNNKWNWVDSMRDWHCAGIFILDHLLHVHVIAATAVSGTFYGLPFKIEYLHVRRSPSAQRIQLHVARSSGWQSPPLDALYFSIWNIRWTVFVLLFRSAPTIDCVRRGRQLKRALPSAMLWFIFLIFDSISTNKKWKVLLDHSDDVH